MNLFTPIVPSHRWHPNFSVEVRHPNVWNRQVLNHWAEGFVDRDGKFVQEFQTNFNSCFWELYLHATLREYRCSIDFSKASPDFIVTDPVPFTLEAAIANHPIDRPPEFATQDSAIPDDLNDLNRQAIIRLANAVHTKYDKYKSHYATLSHVAGKPFVIAVAPFDRPYFYLACQRAIEALLYNYYVDEEEWLEIGLDAHAPKRVLDSVAKDSGAPIDLGLFLGNEMPEVSAVVFSSCATWGKVRALSADPNPNISFTALRLNMAGTKPHYIHRAKADYQESLLDGLRVYHNPFARHPLELAAFRNPAVMQAYYSHEEKEWKYEQVEAQLLFRSVFTIKPRN